MARLTSVSMPPSPVIADLVRELTRTFDRATHKRGAHHQASELLTQASRDPLVLTEALARYVSAPNSLNRKNYPVVAVPVASTPHFELVLNCWIPLPDRRTDLTTKAIHHHGDLLLSTTNVFGPGYEHWLFSSPRWKHGLVHTMSVLDVRPHRLHEVAFVDAHVPHVPLYPKTLSITMALWSTRFDTSWKDHIKRIGFLKRRAATLRTLAIAAGLKRALELKVADDFDFSPVNGGFEAMKERKEFELGPNEDHLQSVFHILQETGNQQLGPLIRKTLATQAIQNATVVTSLLARLDANQPIEGKLSAGHYGIPFANFTAQDIRRVLEATDGPTPF